MKTIAPLSGQPSMLVEVLRIEPEAAAHPERGPLEEPGDSGFRTLMYDSW